MLFDSQGPLAMPGVRGNNLEPNNAIHLSSPLIDLDGPFGIKAAR